MSSNSMELEDAMKAAAQDFGPVTGALLSRAWNDRSTFAKIYPIVREEMEAWGARLNSLTGRESALLLDETSFYNWAGQIFRIVYDKQAVTAPVVQSKPVDPNPQVAPTPNGTNTCFTCKLSFATFPEVMAHKVLAHGYQSSKYTVDWAKDVARSQKGGWPTPATPASLQADPQPVTASGPGINMLELWKPTMNLDLRGLDLSVGEASRFAVGDDAHARFYFVRMLKDRTSIKGQFVWTKFAHRFTTVNAYQGDFVVKKMAGDTQEWIGIQSPKGVWMAKDRQTHYEHTYVGSREEDIAEILKDPYEARRRYGLLLGKCGYCGRKLTDSLSRARGIGPDCWDAKGMHDLAKHIHSTVKAGASS